jgi:hypothetical protein
VGAGLGFRPDLWLAMHGAMFWIKWAYTGSLALCATLATVRLARPDAGMTGWLWVACLPVLGLAAISVQELASVPHRNGWPCGWAPAGKCARPMCSCFRCRFLAGCSGPSGGWRPRSCAGGGHRRADGGAWGATLYCLHCPESSAIFVLTWYTLGMVLAAGAGAMLGPRLLRW